MTTALVVLHLLRGSAITPVMVQEAGVFGFEFEFVAALAFTESSLDPDARNIKTGAVGLLQIARGGAVPKSLSYMSDEQLSDPHRNLALGLAYMSRLREKCRGAASWLSLWDGRGKCRPSPFSLKVIKTWKELKHAENRSLQRGRGPRRHQEDDDEVRQLDRGEARLDGPGQGDLVQR